MGLTVQCPILFIPTLLFLGMSRAKPVSAAEKRIRILDLFNETAEVWQLKEIEKMAPTRKGVVSQSVKDIVDGLVSDGLVQTERVGSR